MITFTLSLHPWRSIKPIEIDRLRRYAIGFTSDIFQPRPEPDLKEDGTDKNQPYREAYDRGDRWPRDDIEIVVPLEHLSRFLPCEIHAVHGHLTLENHEQRTAAVVNTRVKVVVPGPALQAYDEVKHENDCCTDHLQNELNDGWRILAVCVQPDQRRPDYILGRGPEYERRIAQQPLRAPRDRPSPMPINPNPIDPPVAAPLRDPDDDYPF